MKTVRFRRAGSMMALGIAALCGCGDRGATESASASASAAEPPAPPPIETQLYPEGPSLLAETKLFERVPREAQGFIVVAGLPALAPALPESALTPQSREAILSLLSGEVARRTGLSSDLKITPRRLADLEALVGALDFDRPFGVALLDEVTEARALYAHVRDAAAVEKAANKLLGLREPKTVGSAKVWWRKTPVGVVIKDDVAVIVDGGYWIRTDAKAGAELWTDRIAKVDVSTSFSGEPWLAAAKEQVRFGKQAAVVIKPGVFGSQTLANDRFQQKRRGLEDKGANKEVLARSQELIDGLVAAQRALDARAPAFVAGIEVTRDEVRFKGWLAGAEGRAPLEPMRPLPPAFAELADRSVQLSANVGKDAAAAIGADRLRNYDRGGCSVRARDVAPYFTGEVVVLEGAIAWTVNDDAAAWTAAKASVEKASGNPAKPSWNVDETTRTLTCSGGGLRVAPGWFLMSKKEELLKSFPAASGAQPVEIKPRVKELGTIADVIAQFRPPLAEQDRLLGFGAMSGFDGPCGLFPGGGLFSQPNEEQLKARKRLCDDLTKLEEEQTAARSKAESTSASLLGRFEMVAKAGAGGAHVYGIWTMAPASPHELASKLVEVWAPAAPSGDRVKKMVELEKKLEALDKETLKQGLDTLGPAIDSAMREPAFR